MEDLIDITENIQRKSLKEREISKCTNYVGGRFCDFKDSECPDDCPNSLPYDPDLNVSYK